VAVEKSTSLQKWIEPLVDLTSFGAVELFSLMSREIAIMHPYAVGAMTAASTHALSVTATKKFFNPQTTEGQIAATIMGLAISTLALPYIIGKWGIHTAIRLNFETAVRTAVTGLVVKSTIFTLYTLGKSFLDQHHWEAPKDLKDLDSFGTTQLKHVKAFFMNHTDQRKELTLALQQALSVPLGACSGIGDGWTKESLGTLRGKDLDFLTLEQKRELNALFMKHNLLPSNREYVKGELPPLPKSLTGLSHEQLTWVHLISQLSDTEVSPELARQFYEQGLPPAKSEWIDWRLPIHVDLLNKTDLRWVKNDLIAHPEKWKALDLETQRGLKQRWHKEKITPPYLIHPHSAEEVEKLSSSELKDYGNEFQSTVDLKVIFPLEMRRVFADRIEDELGLDVDCLFFDNEQRVEPHYLIGRVTTKQAFAIGLIVMVVAVPAIAAIGSLFYQTATPPQPEPVKENKNQTQEVLPLPVEEVCLPKVDPCPNNNCLTIPLGSKVIDHPVELPKRNIQIIDHCVAPPSKVDHCLDSSWLAIPKGSEVIDHPVSASNITVFDKSWVLEEPAQKVDDVILPHLFPQQHLPQEDFCPDNNCLIVAPDPAYNVVCEAPQFAVPPVFEPFHLPPPTKVLITPTSGNDSFSILDPSPFDVTQTTETVAQPIFQAIPKEPQGSYSGAVWTGVVALGTILTLGLFRKKREVQQPPPVQGREIAVIKREKQGELVEMFRDAQAVAVEVEMDNERFQWAFDPSDPIVLQELYRLTQSRIPAIEGGSIQLDPSGLRVRVGIDNGGIRQAFQLQNLTPAMVRFFTDLALEARKFEQSVALQVGQQRALEYHAPEVHLPPLHNRHNRFPVLPDVVRLSSSQTELNQSLMRSIMLEEGPSGSKEVRESRYVAWSHFIGENGHPAKMRKYRVVLDEYLRVMQEQFKQNPLQLLWSLQERTEREPKNVLYAGLFRAIETLMYPIDPRGEYVDASTQRYTFVQSLRGSILSREYQAIEAKDEEALSLDEKFCRDTIWMLSESFFRPEIYNYLKDVTDLFVHESRSSRGELDDQEAITAANLPRRIDEKNTDIKRAPKDKIGKSNLALQYQKACGALGCEDFIGTKNTPHLRNQYVWQHPESGEDLVVDYFRHGCPVLPGNLLRIALGAVTRYIPWWMVGYDMAVRSGESVAPEYEQMLRAKAARKEGDLYVNHQRRTPGGLENEWDRVEAIEGLQSRHPNEFVLTQSVEGTFFKCEGIFAEITTFEGLIDGFIRTYSQPDKVGDHAQNMLPEVFWNRDWWGQHTTLNEQGLRYLAELKKKLQGLHQFFFDGRENIDFKGVNPVNPEEAYSLREWQVFIELCYSFMRKDLMFTLSEQSGFTITSMKDICKDKLDRGGNEAKNEDEIAYHMIGDLRDERFEETLYQLLGPPILVKKKEAIPRRLKPGLALSQFLHSMPPEKKLAMREFAKEFFSGWQMKEVRVGKRKGQKAFPTRATARTKEEYRAYLYSKGKKEAEEVEEILRRKFSPVRLKEASEPEEIYAFLENVRPKAYVSTAETQVRENVKPYMQDSEINQVKLFQQIDKDLKRDHGGMSCVLLNGKRVDSAEALFGVLSTCSKDTKEVLSWMSLLQQGLFAGIEQAMWNDLEIGGHDSGFQVRGHGTTVQKKPAVREYRITAQENQKPLLEAFSYYELISSDPERLNVFRDLPYAVLQAKTKVELESNRALSIWHVDEVIKS